MAMVASCCLLILLTSVTDVAFAARSADSELTSSPLYESGGSPIRYSTATEKGESGLVMTGKNNFGADDGGGASKTSNVPTWVPDEIIVILNESRDPEFRAFLSNNSVVVKETNSPARAYLVSTNASPESTMNKMKAAGIAGLTQRNWIGKAPATPNDPYYRNAKVCQVGYCTPQIGLLDNQFANFAWDSTPGTGTVINVAVIDSGINYNHVDLIPVMWNGNPMHGIDTTGVNPADTMDQCDHGTAAASLIASGWNNGIGVVGMARTQVKVMAVKVFGPTCGVDSWDLREGIDWANLNNAKVLYLGICVT